jgi:hypothetical protein
VAQAEVLEKPRAMCSPQDLKLLHRPPIIVVGHAQLRERGTIVDGVFAARAAGARRMAPPTRTRRLCRGRFHTSDGIP